MGLDDIDSEEIEDTILEIEKSLKIEFAIDELQEVRTFGDLCDKVLKKIHYSKAKGCTSQQAFYRLRKLCVDELGIQDEHLRTATPLELILDRKNRRRSIKKIEEKTGLRIVELRPPNWISYLLAILMLIALIYLFVNWKIAALMLSTSILGFWIAEKLGNELESKTFGDFVKRITTFNYMDVRRLPNSVNVNEIEGLIRNLFQIRLDLEASDLTRSCKF